MCSLLQTCLTTPADSSCSISEATSVPALVTNLDKCMTSVEDATCTASYGSSANLISGGGSGMVGWIQQLSKISPVTSQSAPHQHLQDGPPWSSAPTRPRPRQTSPSLIWAPMLVSSSLQIISGTVRLLFSLSDRGQWEHSGQL